MEAPHAGPGNTGILTAIEDTRGKEIPIALDIPKPFANERLKLKSITTVIFTILIVASISSSLLYATFWFNMSQSDQFTNTFSAFFGFMTANTLTVVGSFCGILTLYENPISDTAHSDAVVWLLTSGILFTIVFPTSALIPISSDGSSRVPTMSLQECTQKSKLPECSSAEYLKIVLYCMYIPIIFELAALVFYCFVWRRRFTAVVTVEFSPAVIEVDQASRSGAGDEVDDASTSLTDFY